MSITVAAVPGFAFAAAYLFNKAIRSMSSIRSDIKAGKQQDTVAAMTKRGIRLRSWRYIIAKVKTPTATLRQIRDVLATASQDERDIGRLPGPCRRRVPHRAFFRFVSSRHDRHRFTKAAPALLRLSRGRRDCAIWPTWEWLLRYRLF